MTAEMEPMNYHSRMHAFEEILDSSSALRVVDIPQLRALSLQGIPEHPVWMRSRIWRLLLGALPPEKDKWEDMARKSRARYYDVAAQLLQPIQTAPPPEYPLNARDKLLDTIAKDVDRTQPRIPFFRRPIDPLQSWPKPPTNASPKSTDAPSDEKPAVDVANALFDRLTVVQRVVRFGGSAPPPVPRTPEIRVMVAAPNDDQEHDETPADQHAENSGDGNGNNSNSAASKESTDSEDDDQPLAFKAGGRSSLGLSINPPTPHLSPQLGPIRSHTHAPTLQLNGQSDYDDDPPETKTHAHILLRILYVYSLLHPHHPYTQGLNELLAPLYYTVFEGRSAGLRSYTLGVRHEELVGEAAARAAGELVAKTESLTLPNQSSKPTELEDEEDDPTQHIEADTFWLFVELMGELGSVVGDPGDWSLPPVASGSGEGVRGVMARLSDRLRWADARLWEDMVKKSLDPKLPYFSYRWIACLLAQDLPLTALLPTWDTLFAQNPSTPETNPKIEWLLNICVALLLGVRERLVRAGNKRGGVGLWGEEEEEDDDMPLSMIQSGGNGSTSPIPNGGGPFGMNEAFVQGMLLLQRYPLESVGLEWVINKAFELDAKRAAGFGIIEGNNPGGAGWGGIAVNGGWMATAMRNRVAGWRAAPAAPVTQGAASTTPVPDVLVSPPAPALASVRGKINQYTETFKQSDAAASLSKASTNWSLAVMSAWNRSGGQHDGNQAGPSTEQGPTPPPKDGRIHGRGHGHGRSDSWAGWGAAAVAAAKMRAAAIAKPRAAGVPESVAEEDPQEAERQERRDSIQLDIKVRGRSPGNRSQSLSPTALANVMATTQPLIAQQRTATYPHSPMPRSALDAPADYEPPPRPAVFKNPRDSWLPTPKRSDTYGETSPEEDPNHHVPPVPSPNHRFTMTLPGWSAMPPSSPSATTTKKTTGPKPLLLGKNRQSTSTASSTARFRGMSRQSSISSSTGSHREWEMMAALSPRSDSGSLVGRPDSGSFAARSRRSMGTGSMPPSAAGSLAPSEDEAVFVGPGLRGSSDQGSPPNPASGASSSRFSPPVVVPRAPERPTSTELKRTSSPLSMSMGTGGFSTGPGSAADSPRGSWQLADGPVTAEPAPVRKWELTDGPTPASVEVSDSRSKAETMPVQLEHSNSTATVRKFELTDGPAAGRASTTSALATTPAANEPSTQSPVVPPFPRKWELSDNPVPRIEPNLPPAMTADSDAADSPVLAPGETRGKAWPKRTSSNRPTNLNLRVKPRPGSTASIGDKGDGLRTPQVEENLVTPTSASTLPYMRTPSPDSMQTPLPQVEERTPRRKKQGQAAPAQNRRSKAIRGTQPPEVMSEEDGVKADAEDGEEYEEWLSAYETDDTSHGAGHAR